MGLEAPVGGGVHAGGGEGGEAELVLALGDVLSSLLQIVKAGDVLGLVASLGEEVLVVDEAVGLDGVGDALNLVVGALQREGVVGEFLLEVGVVEVDAVVLPGSEAHGAVDLEQGRGLGLGHLGLEGGLVLTGSGGLDGNLDTGLLGVDLGELLPLSVLLGLEVEVVHLAGSLLGSGGAGAGIAVAAASEGSEDTSGTKTSGDE